MKISTFILTGSVAVNAALLFFVVAAPSNRATTNSASSTARPKAESNTSTARRTESAATWSAIQSDDLATQADRLRAEGFPPSAIRAITAAQIRESFASRRKAIEAAQGELPFWKNPSADPKIQAELRAISKMEQQALKDLLGPDPENSAAATLRRQLPGLFPEKIEELAAVRDRYNQMRNDFYANLTTTTVEDRQKIVDMDKAQRAEIAALLTPQEFEEYEIRTSNTATSLRNTLSAFDPSEAEFRAIYKLQSAFNEQYQTATLTALPPDQQTALLRQRTEGQKQLTEEIKAALGPERYADYQRGTDPSYRQTSQLVARLELPIDAANQVYVVQKEVQQRVQSLTTDRSITLESRNAQLTALAAEVESRVTATLGPTGYEAWKTNGGSWITQLQPRPIPAPTGR